MIITLGQQKIIVLLPVVQILKNLRCSIKAPKFGIIYQHI